MIAVVLIGIKVKNLQTLTKPYPGYNNLNFYEEFGPGAFLSRARAEGLRDFGAALSPQNAFYIMLGVETIGPRMMKHVSNAEYIASFLLGKDEVSWVKHPSLKSHKGHKLASKLMPKGAGSNYFFWFKRRKKTRCEIYRKP